ncbi:hypothetical protein BMS3Bbin06_00566 [bacterium BMS3Bbin06]|nr:hypothetical protein BMS3Abin08_02303 [bacterium BMS3Abin08]GBE34050.1 hypothetical protein BMS3Bbin06_00566 [bacterium BMS3Bbin06]
MDRCTGKPGEGSYFIMKTHYRHISNKRFLQLPPVVNLAMVQAHQRETGFLHPV